MSTVRLILCLSLAACAPRPTMKAGPAPSSRYELCKDPELHCVPAWRPVKVDTNLDRHEQTVLVANRFRV